MRSALRRRPAFLTARRFSSSRFELESPAGKFLRCMKGNQPNTVSAAEQLECFALEGDEATSHHNNSSATDESTLRE